MSRGKSPSAESRDGGTRAFDFDLPLSPDGYAWWYVDALSDDGLHGITLIALLGCVFSPYYARARRRGAVDPLHHCAMNIALYKGRSRRWAMTEYGRADVFRDASWLTIGANRLHWDGMALTFAVDDVAAPLPSRIRGTVRITPRAISNAEFMLDREGLHRWRPIAPCARVEVALEQPAQRWTGAAYVDSNRGDVPLERTFAGWHWSRTTFADGSSAVLYDVEELDGYESGLALWMKTDGAIERIASPERHDLPSTGWRVKRATRAENIPARIVRTLEDTPFYARSVIETTLCGNSALAIHESLSLDRFRAGWVQRLLPFRMRRSTP